MKESAAGGHNHSPQFIIRIAKQRSFTAWYKECLVNNWLDGQPMKEATEVEEAKENTADAHALP
jgi:hypothetical protein